MSEKKKEIVERKPKTGDKIIEIFENNVTIKTDEQTDIDGLIRKKDAFKNLMESPRENFEKKSKFKADRRKKHGEKTTMKQKNTMDNWLRK